MTLKPYNIIHSYKKKHANILLSSLIHNVVCFGAGMESSMHNQSTPHDNYSSSSSQQPAELHTHTV